LQQLDEVYIIGTQSINVMVDISYHLPNLQWDINVKNMADADYIFNVIKQYIIDKKSIFDAFFDKYNYAIKEINIDKSLSLTKVYVILYERTHKKLLHFNLINFTFLKLESRPYLEINLVKYVDIKTIYNIIQRNIKRNIYRGPLLQKMHERLRVINSAVENNGMSCNYYKYQFINTSETRLKNNLTSCLKNISIGPHDYELPKKLQRADGRPQFRGSLLDVKAHDTYLRKVTPAIKKIILDYTNEGSKRMNSELIRYYNYESDVVSNDVLKLQETILLAPPLKEDLYVYRLSSIYFTGNTSTYNLQVGDIHYNDIFISTSMDNWYNPSTFVVPFSTCCAYVIKIPRGSHVLIINKHSTMPSEYEVLLPYNSKLKINRVAYTNITYATNHVWYNTTKTYYSVFSNY
jgi:hypothetical protein